MPRDDERAMNKYHEPNTAAEFRAVTDFACKLTSNNTDECGWCRAQLTGRQRRWCSRKCNRIFVSNHRWTQARAEAKKKATRYECSDCHGFFEVVEVNHIVPCRGLHSTWGCWHHSDNLEVLCVGCHRLKTNQQRARGWT